MSRWREHWQYWCFRLEQRIVLACPFHALARLLLRRVPRDKGFDKFDDFQHRGRVMHAALIGEKPCDAESGEFGDEPIAVADVAYADELQRVKAQLADAVEVLKAKEAQRIERWKTILAVSAGAAGAIGLLIAMASLFFAR